VKTVLGVTFPCKARKFFTFCAVINFFKKDLASGSYPVARAVLNYKIRVRSTGFDGA
jgi:hypothetical protein